jgi:hypothetical protein
MNDEKWQVIWEKSFRCEKSPQFIGWLTSKASTASTNNCCNVIFMMSHYITINRVLVPTSTCEWEFNVSLLYIAERIKNKNSTATICVGFAIADNEVVN